MVHEEPSENFVASNQLVSEQVELNEQLPPSPLNLNGFSNRVAALTDETVKPNKARLIIVK
jgi:hypothetical protein